MRDRDLERLLESFRPKIQNSDLEAIQSIISDNLLPDLDLLRDRDRRGGGLRDRLGERDRDRSTKI